MQDIIKINILNFSLIYLLLLIVLFIMKKCRINETKLLFWASIRMTVQLTLAGYILTYIIKNPHPLFVVAYLLTMIIFATHRVISKNNHLTTGFKYAIGISIGFSGLFVLFFFVTVVVGESIFNPQYAIPLGGMVMGNAMTGVNIGVKTFLESVYSQKNKINVLLNIGATPNKILLPFVNQSLQTALLPTLNSMMGMGIVSLPGMMTGQILSGTLPTTSILYQISIMVGICTVVCLSVFGSLYLGYQTMYNEKKQIII